MCIRDSLYTAMGKINVYMQPRLGHAAYTLRAISSALRLGTQ